MNAFRRTHPYVRSERSERSAPTACFSTALPSLFLALSFLFAGWTTRSSVVFLCFLFSVVRFSLAFPLPFHRFSLAPRLLLSTFDQRFHGFSPGAFLLLAVAYSITFRLFFVYYALAFALGFYACSFYFEAGAPTS